MEAKIKAEELVLKYLRKNFSTWINKTDAKKCALIAVDEIIEELSKIHLLIDINIILNFWQEVKAEIKKL